MVAADAGHEHSQNSNRSHLHRPQHQLDLSRRRKSSRRQRFTVNTVFVFLWMVFGGRFVSALVSSSLAPLSNRLLKVGTNSRLVRNYSHTGTKQVFMTSKTQLKSERMAPVDGALVVVIAGPTAVGKSDVAVEICRQQKGIIVSADSVQAYKGVQIGANKPSLEERQETPHILVDVADHNLTYTAADWNRDALHAIEELLLSSSPSKLKVDYSMDEHGENDEQNLLEQRQQRKEQISKDIQSARYSKGYTAEEALLPVVCGGTMMYIQWLVHGRPDAMKPSPEAVEEAKTTMEKYEDKEDFEGAVEQIKTFGGKFAARAVHFCHGDWYRLRRTLEVALTVKGKENEQELINALYTGERQGGLPTLGYDVRCFFLCPKDRMVHATIVDQRCEQMIQKGLLKETTDLLLSGTMPDMAQKAIGYRQTLEYLQDDSTAFASEEERYDQFLNDFCAATRRYAKQQMSWFRRDSKFVFVPVDSELPKADRLDSTTSSIQEYCNLSRSRYESSMNDPEGPSTKCKLFNEQQGKKMKRYQPKRYILTKGSEEYASALQEALECRQRIRSNKRQKTEAAALEDGVAQ